MGWGVLALLPFMALLLLAGCSDAAARVVASDIVSASGHLPGSTGTGWNDSDGDDDNAPTLNPDAARAIVRANAVREAHLSARAAREDLAGQLLRRLVTRSTSVLTDSAQETKAVGALLGELAEKEVGALALEAERILFASALDLELGATSHALERFALGEAALETVRRDMAAALPTGSLVPRDCFGIASRERLERTRAGLISHRDHLRALESIIDDGRLSAAIKHLSGRIDRVEKVLGSAEYAAFEKEGKQLFEKVDTSLWRDASVTRPTRIEKARSALVAELEAATGFRELKLASIEVRGPPDVLALRSVRDFNIDPIGWCRAESELAAMSEVLGSDAQIPEELRRADANPLARIACTLEDGTLRDIVRLQEQLAGVSGIELPSDFLFADRSEHLAKWRAAAISEFQRRAGAGSRVHFDGSWFSRRPPLDQARVEAHFLHAAHSRFPNRATRPPALGDEIAKIVTTTVRECSQATEAALARYSRLARQIGASDATLAEAAAKSLYDAQEAVARLAVETEKLVSIAEQAGVEVRVRRNALWIASGLAPRGPPPKGQGPDASGSVQPRPSDPNQLPRSPGSRSILSSFGGEDAKIDRYQPRIARLVADAHSHADAVQKAMEAADTVASKMPSMSAKPIGEAKGRLTVSRTQLRNPGFDAGKITRNASLKRLPDAHVEWKGRLDPDTGRSYSFTEAVKKAKSFRAVGGGVHFGETAKKVGPEDLSTAVLIYDRTKGLLFRDARSGNEWIVANDVDATSMRALFRFAMSGRNAAISIGWGQTRGSFWDAVDRARSGESAVLLDPFLVDTKVGQDLILADSIPWELDEITYADGSAVLFAKEFEKAKGVYQDVGRNTLLKCLQGIDAIKDAGSPELQQRLRELKLPALVRFAFQFDAVDEKALNWLYAETATEVEQESLSSMITATNASLGSSDRTPVQRITSILTASFAKRLKQSVPAHERHLIDEQKLHDVARKEAMRSALEFLVDVKKRATALYEDGTSKQRRALLMQVLLSSFADDSEPNRELVETWAALRLGEGERVSEVAEELHNLLNATTLAILFDDWIRFSMTSGGVEFTTRMRYRYATTYIVVDAKRIGLGRDASGSEVQTIPALTDLANENIEALLTGFPYLARTTRHAAIAGLFRWAIAATETGELGFFDPSALARSPTNDREGSPTIDVLQRD